MTRNPITESSEWTFDLLDRFDYEIGQIAAEYKLDTFPNQIEVITAEQMMDAYSSVGMPVNYHHWSFGKQFVSTQKRYKRGEMGLAYEIVINSDPCVSYLMEENTAAMQALVIAHAAYGHNSFFKNNYLFTTWTSADAIIDYLLFARNYIADCEHRYGVERVEEILDSCHALMNYGVDRYKRPSRLSMREEQLKQKERESYLQSQVNELWRTIPVSETQAEETSEPVFPDEPQENVLYFIEKNAPLLEPWEREIVRIVRKVAQYFYPQKQTKVMNEGWATFWHYTILNTMYDRGLINDGFMLEILKSHTNVIYQPEFSSPYFSGLNPYTLGFAMMSDIRRICESPTDEDKHWFPDIAGTDWVSTLDFAMRNFKDESFISQYLSPKVIRDLKLFCVIDDDKKDFLEIKEIHDDHGYRAIRQALADQYNLGSLEPNIQVAKVDRRGDRSLTLQHTQYHRRPLAESCEEVMKHVARLWGFTVRMEALKEDGKAELLTEIKAEH